VQLKNAMDQHFLAFTRLMKVRLGEAVSSFLVVLLMVTAVLGNGSSKHQQTNATALTVLQRCHCTPKHCERTMSTGRDHDAEQLSSGGALADYFEYPSRPG
jgi:hypothetical protein